jgi:hypothetical protein
MYPIILIGYNHVPANKSAVGNSHKISKPQKHIIHKAIRWKKMLDDGAVRSMSEIAGNEGLTRARVAQIMNLLKLPAEVKEFLVGLDDSREIMKYSERRLRNSLKSKTNDQRTQ